MPQAQFDVASVRVAMQVSSCQSSGSAPRRPPRPPEGQPDAQAAAARRVSDSVCKPPLGRPLAPARRPPSPVSNGKRPKPIDGRGGRDQAARSCPPPSHAAVSTELELTVEEVLRAAGFEGDNLDAHLTDGDFEEAGSGLASIGQLFYRHRGLRSLKTPRSVDFAELIGLRVLSLSENALTDLGPLAELPCLQELNVSHNRISDLRPMAKCISLEVLLASNNRIAALAGLQALQALSRLSLFSNMLSDLTLVVEELTSLPSLRYLDLGGNACCSDPSHSYSLIRSLPNLIELDGEPLGPMERQLAHEFFACAKELGLQERPGTAGAGFARPRTAPALGARSLSSTAPCSFGSLAEATRDDLEGRARAVKRQPSSRAASSSPEDFSADILEDEADLTASLQRRKAQVDALRLRVQTVQIDCENLRRQIQELRDQEPEMGTAQLREQLALLEQQNRKMHERAELNRELRLRLERRRIEYVQHREELGLPLERPCSVARPRTAAAAAEAVLSAMDAATGRLVSPSCATGTASLGPIAALKAQGKFLRKQLQEEQQLASKCQAAACEAALGKPLS